MKKNLSYFMKKNKEPEIVSVLGPESFVDENGARIMFQIKKCGMKFFCFSDRTFCLSFVYPLG